MTEGVGDRLRDYVMQAARPVTAREAIRLAEDRLVRRRPSLNLVSALLAALALTGLTVAAVVVARVVGDDGSGPTERIVTGSGPEAAAADRAGYRGIVGVDFLDAEHGWVAVEHRCPGCVVIFTTADGGETWRTAGSEPEAIRAGNYELRVIDDTNAWLFPRPDRPSTSRGEKTYTTDDGGRTWRAVEQEGTTVGVAAVGDEVWRIDRGRCDDDCEVVLLVSRDGSSSWQAAEAQPPVVGARIVLERAGDGSTGWVLSAAAPEGQSLLAATTDGARSWSTTPLPCRSAPYDADLASSSPTALWLLCLHEPASGALQVTELYRSSDGGATWSADLGGVGGGSNARLAVADSQRACHGGVRTSLWCTGDGGRTWTEAVPGLLANPRDGGVDFVGFADGGTGWFVSQDDASGYFNRLWRSTDGGTTWREIATPWGPEPLVEAAEGADGAEETATTSDAGPEPPTDDDRAVVDALVRFARSPGPATLADLPLDTEGVWLGLGPMLMVREYPDDLAEPAAWKIEMDLWRAYVGPFSALDLLRDSQGVVVSVGPHPHCIAPAVPAPPELAGLRRVSIQPAGVTSCVEWWTVDLFLTPEGDIAGVTVDLFEP